MWFWMIANEKGQYLPILDRKNAVGYSYLEVQEPTSDKPPRLFPNKLGAVNALASWKRGPLIKKAATTPIADFDQYDPFGDKDYPEELGTMVVPGEEKEAETRAKYGLKPVEVYLHVKR